MFLNINNKWTFYFHYHLKCQNITDNEGDIELKTIESSQNTGIACNLSNCDLFMWMDSISHISEYKEEVNRLFSLAP